MGRLLITLLIGTSGGLAGYYSRFPAGTLLGAMLAVGIYNSLGFQSFMHPCVRIGVQIVVGCMLGLNLNRNTFMELKTIVVPVIIIVISLLVFGILIGLVIYKFCKLDLATALLGSAPGGMTELSLLAVSLGANGPKVALLHAIRMITIVSVMPSILNWMLKVFSQKP